MVAKALRAQSGTPVISTLIDFAHTSETDKLSDALQKLQDGYFDWVTATNPTVVDILTHHNITIADRTQIALSGEATYQAFIDAGYAVARTPEEDDLTTAGLLKAWPEINDGSVLKVLTLRSDVAKPVLTEGLIARGHDVTQVVAYRTVGVPASVHVHEDILSGDLNAIVVSSPQVAREVVAQFPDRPSNLIIACVGEATRQEAERLGLRSGDDAPQDIIDTLVETVRDSVDPADLMD